MPTRIALIHATPVAMPPVTAAFQRGWQEAETVHLLDDALSRDLARAGELNAAMKKRIAALAAYATDIGVAGILFTCSAFGEAIDAVAQQARMPVLKPNEAMFEEALRGGKTVGLLATFQPSIPSLQQEFVAMAAAQGQDVKLESVWVPKAMDALSAGDAATHHHLIAAVVPRLAHCDVIMLAQFSMAGALPVVQQVASCPVLTSPDSAVIKLKAALT
jgi:aspartate/glutamate racemase